MQVGGVRRIEVPGERPELSYSRDRSERFVQGFKYRRMLLQHEGPHGKPLVFKTCLPESK